MQKCLFAGNHCGKRRTGRVGGSTPWASVTRRAWVPTTLWCRSIYYRNRLDCDVSPFVPTVPSDYNAMWVHLRFSTKKKKEKTFPCCLAWTGGTIQLWEEKSKQKGLKDPQLPMVWKVAQQTEHYAFSKSKCCWQAGWLQAGEGLSASLQQIQTSRTVDICSGRAPQLPQSRRASRQDGPLPHTTNKMHAVFFIENATLFYNAVPPHRPIHFLFFSPFIFEADALWEA